MSPFPRAAALAALLAAPTAALAVQVEIPLRDTGNYLDDGFHNPSNPVFAAGKVGSLTVRNFFVFDLAGFVDPVEVLSLTVAPTGDYSSTDLAETITFRSYEGDPGLLINGTAELAGYADLGDGTIYGSVEVATPVFDTFTPMPEVTIRLNDAAVVQANQIIAAVDEPADVNDKLFAFGGEVGTATTSTQGLWFFDSAPTAATLTGGPAAIPPPAALPLAAAGLGALGLVARRRRRA